jgi:succinyl-diaminopimelate desuccinylase
MAEKYGNDLILKAEGVSTHGATPEGAINCAYLIAEELKDCDFLDNCDRELMSTLAELLKSPYGEAVGIENDDAEFGRLTMTNGMIDIVDSRVSLTFDLRFGKEIKVDKMLKVLEASLDKMGFDLEIISADNAYAIDTENEYFKRYIEAYKSYTGEENINLRINAGSTYAKCIGKACEVGTRYKGTRLSLPNGHGNAHQPDENISIDGLLNAMEIIIYSVAELCK